MDSPIQQITEALNRYLDCQIALHQFEDVFLPLLWDIDSTSTAAAVELAGRIHNLSAEFSRGDRTEQSLREELENAVRPFVSHRLEISNAVGSAVVHFRQDLPNTPDTAETGSSQIAMLRRMPPGRAESSHSFDTGSASQNYFRVHVQRA